MHLGWLSVADARDVADWLLDAVAASSNAAPLVEQCEDLIATKVDEFLRLQLVVVELLGPERGQLSQPVMAPVEPIFQPFGWSPPLDLRVDVLQRGVYPLLVKSFDRAAQRSGRLVRHRSLQYLFRNRRFLFDGWGAVKSSSRCSLVVRWAHFSFGARVLAECSWELSRLLNSMRGRQAARKQRELAEAGWGRRGAAGLNGCWRDRTCQVAIRILRATADLAGFLPARLATSV
jgi:hypothetical protein